MLCAANEMFRHYDFDPIDLMIIHAVLNANVLNILKNPELDRRFGSVQASRMRSSRAFPALPSPASLACPPKPSGDAPTA